MKTLVTGATGFIGSAVVRELLESGKEIRVTCRKDSNTGNIDGLDVEKVYADIQDRDSIEKALKGCGNLFHVAAHFAHWSPNKDLFYKINVEGTKTIFKEALNQGVEKVVYTSTSNTIGSHGAGNFVDETAEFNGWETGDHYAISKYLAEQEAIKLCQNGLPLVIVNPTLVIGVRDIKPTPSGAMIVDIVNRDMPGYIDGAINVIDVEDVARGHVLAAEKGKVGERYVLGNENLTVGGFFNMVGNISGVKPPRLKIPYRIALMLGYLFEFGSRFTKKPPVVSASQVILGNMGEHFNNSKAINELGLTLTPIEETIAKTVQWFRENRYIKKV